MAMPKLDKVFTLEITVEQFLRACSEIELQELKLLLHGEMRRREMAIKRELLDKQLPGYE
jgi:hypothetical protein